MMNEEDKFDDGLIIKDNKWNNIKKEFKEVNFDKIEGRNFLNKMEILIACMSKH